MIKRYSNEHMRKIWTENNKFKAYLEVEILSAEAWSEIGKIPKNDCELLRKNSKFDIDRIYEIEKETRHDIVAFTRSVSESLGSEKKWIHYGLTSTDVVDTANGYLLKQANDIIRKDIIEFIKILKTNAMKYKMTPCIGRTHGVHADITSFGLKWALWYDEMIRNQKRFEEAAQGVEVGKISGAVGNFANTPPSIQDFVCKKLKINTSNISTQTLQRDRYAVYFSVIALIGATIEKIGIEIRHLQRTEVREVEEAFGKRQKGSSAMPHKRNPIGSENMAGCARVLRGYMIAAYENISLWHERDISHSSAERIIFPDATMLIDYMLQRFSKIIKNLTVFEDRMKENIFKTNGVIFTQRVMTKLIDAGLDRETSYDLIQPLAMNAWENNLLLIDLLKQNKIILEKITEKEIDDCFTVEYYLNQVDNIFKRVFK